MFFASSVTFDLSLEDLIQRLGDTSWILFKDERDALVGE